MMHNWVNAEEYGRAGTGKRETSAKAVQPDRHGTSVVKTPATAPKSATFTVSAAGGRVTIKDVRKRR